jgi:hypothetical protein
MRRCQHVLEVLALGFLFGDSLCAQPPTPKKIVFVDPIGGPPPPFTHSFLFNIPVGVAIGPRGLGRNGQAVNTPTVWVADPVNNQVVGFPFLDPGPFPPFATGVENLSSLPCPISVRGCVVPNWQLNSPEYVAVDQASGNLWISDTGNDVVVEVDPITGTVVRFAGVGPQILVVSPPPPHPNAGQEPGQFFGPGPLAVDGLGFLYVADGAGAKLSFVPNEPSPPSANIRIQNFDKTGLFLTSWGSYCGLNPDGTQAEGSCNTSFPGAVALGDGQFDSVAGIALGTDDAIYITDTFNNRVQKFSQLTFPYTFLLKWGGFPFATSGVNFPFTAPDGQFGVPGGVAVGADGTVYVVDILNSRIQEFDTSGNFVGKGGSTGTAEAQFIGPFGIASTPPTFRDYDFLCAPSKSGFPPAPPFLYGQDCENGLVVSELGGTIAVYGPNPPVALRGNARVQFLAGRNDTDNDGITDELNVAACPPPLTACTNFDNSSLGFTTFGTVYPGDQTFVIYNTLSPAPPINEIRVRTESFGGPKNLLISFPLGCEAHPILSIVTFNIHPGQGINMHCSTPTVDVEYGPVGFQFTASDGTLASGTLNTGDSVSFDQMASSIKSNLGNIVVVVGGKSTLLTPGQTTFVDSTPPTTTAGVSPSPNANHWNNTNVLVGLNATDNPGGSGVSAITYSLTGGQTGSAVVPGSAAVVPISAEGITTVNFFATDHAGNQESPKSLTVQIDKTPPKLTCSASPSILRPTNRLVPVNLSVTVDDALSGPAGFLLSSVTSNERPPDKDVARDIVGFSVGAPSTSGFLRAERSHTNRVYTFVYTGTDLAGNQGSCTVTVTVLRRHEEDDDHEGPRPIGDRN